MSTIPSVDLGMAALSGIASANISIAVPVLSQNLCYVAIPDSRTGAACFWRSAVGALTPTFPTRSRHKEPSVLKTRVLQCQDFSNRPLRQSLLKDSSTKANVRESAKTTKGRIAASQIML